jgi:hypothetical protein
MRRGWISKTSVKSREKVRGRRTPFKYMYSNCNAMMFKNWTKAKKVKSYLFLVSILVPKHPGAEFLQVVLCIEEVV